MSMSQGISGKNCRCEAAKCSFHNGSLARVVFQKSWKTPINQVLIKSV